MRPAPIVGTPVRLAAGLRVRLPDRASAAVSAPGRRSRLRGAGGRQAGFDAYVSDPAKPVPYLPRPIHIKGDEGEKAWQTWLVMDQRPAAARTDVLTFTSAPLKEPLKVAGEPLAKLVASTTGTDGDFVVS